MTTRKSDRIVRSSGNVFADLDLPHPEQEMLKAQLTVAIYEQLKRRRLTQAQAAKLLGLHQPQVSVLMRCRPGLFSVGKLLEILGALGRDIEIVHRERQNGRDSRVTVRTA
ncbi:MAG: helix-turn-helix transcriptional regulator [Micropepsaceae bacterium]